MDIKKIQLIPPGYSKVVHPETDSDMVLFKDGKNLTSHLSDMAKQQTNIVQVKKDIVILADNWVNDTANSGFWIYDISDVDININTIVDVNIALIDLDKASKIKSANDSFNEKVRLYASEKITEDISADLKLVKQVGVING